MSILEPGPTLVTPEKEHKKQAFWQIYLPLGLGVAAFIGLCVWAALYTAGYIPQAGLPDQQSPAAKVAVIWILLPTCLGSLIQIALLGGLVFLLGKGIHGTPALFLKIRSLLWRFYAMLIKGSDKAAGAVISTYSQPAGVKRLFRKLAFWKNRD
jgi:hypothetical protein